MSKEAMVSLKQRRRLFALGFGIFMALFAGMLGFGQSTEIIIVFSVLGFILGLSGGWMAASVDLWPTNMGDDRQWCKRYMRSTQLERDIFDSYVAPDDEEDRE